MADIELVIKIDEKMYKDIQSRDWKNGAKWFSEEWRAIHNGTPLSKGHGQLVDFDELCKTYWDGNYMEIHKDDLQNIQTIIEADKDCRECKAEHDCYECKKYEESEEKHA